MVCVVFSVVCGSVCLCVFVFVCVCVAVCGSVWQCVAACAIGCRGHSRVSLPAAVAVCVWLGAGCWVLGAGCCMPACLHDAVWSLWWAVLLFQVNLGSDLRHLVGHCVMTDLPCAAVLASAQTEIFK